MITYSIASVIWGDVWAMTGIGFGVVFCVLLLLVFALFALGYVVSMVEGTAKKKKAAPAPLQRQAASVAVSSAASASDADKVAIATALYLYYQNVHDEESDVLTIKSEHNSPWHHELNKHI